MNKYETAIIKFKKEKVLSNEAEVQQAFVNSKESNEFPYEHRLKGAEALIKRIKNNEKLYFLFEEAEYLRENLKSFISSVILYSQTRSNLEVYKCSVCGKSNTGGEGVYSSFIGSSVCDKCEPNKSKYEVHI